MFEVKVSFPFDKDFSHDDEWLRSIAGSSNDSGAGMGYRDHVFERFEFNDALELKDTIKEACPTWNVYMREK